jgi:hypothetical protein
MCHGEGLHIRPNASTPCRPFTVSSLERNCSLDQHIEDLAPGVDSTPKIDQPAAKIAFFFMHENVRVFELGNHLLGIGDKIELEAGSVVLHSRRKGVYTRL